MADVKKALEDIKSAVYGEEVRGAIHDAIEAINEESEEAVKNATAEKESAKSYAKESKLSADEASSHSMDAAKSKKAASTSEQNASTSASAADDYSKQAEGFAGNAANSANEASRYSSNAANSANKANEYALNAATLVEEIRPIAEKVLRKYRNLLNPNAVQITEDKSVINIDNVVPGDIYCCNFIPNAVYHQGYPSGSMDFEIHDNCWATIPNGYTEFTIEFDPTLDPSKLMVVSGDLTSSGTITMPEHFKPYGIDEYINDDLLASVYTEIKAECEKNKELSNYVSDILTYLFSKCTNLANPDNIVFDGMYRNLTIVGLECGATYCCNISTSDIYKIWYEIVSDGETIEIDITDGIETISGGFAFSLTGHSVKPDFDLTDVMMCFDPSADVSRVMLVEGNSLPLRYVPYGFDTHISENLLSSMIFEIESMKNVESEVVTQVDPVFTAYLVADKVHKMEIDSDVSFRLPISKGYSRILVQANITKPVAIDWGTTHFFDSKIPVIATGNYNFLFESDGEHWYAKAESKGSAGTVEKSVDVIVFGNYLGVNHWENAVYKFNVTNGVAEDHGWLSNGTYKFMYHPKIGQIKNTAPATSFALEDGKSIPECIVIPNAIGFLNTGYEYHEPKDIVCYSANANSGIFRGNANANTTIVIPEGVTTLLSNIFTQNYKDNSNQKFILPSTLKSIKNGVFSQTSAGSLYHDLDLPENLSEIAHSAFTNCRFTSIDIPDKVPAINKETFSYCKLLETVEIGAGVTEIGVRAFRECAALKLIRFKGAIAPAIDDTAFYNVTVNSDDPLTVFYPYDGTGYEDNTFRSKFPEGTMFES